MKTLKTILENNEPFALSNENELKYNTVVCNQDIIKKEGGACIYSVYKVDQRENTAWGKNKNAWGVEMVYKLNTNDLTTYPSKNN